MPVLGAVESSTVDVVPESCRRPRKAATPEDAVALVVVAGDDTELLVLAVGVGLAVEVELSGTEDWRHVVRNARLIRGGNERTYALKGLTGLAPGSGTETTTVILPIVMSDSLGE